MDEAQLWSITQGMVLTTFPTGFNSLVFSHTNCLYVADNDHSDHGRVYDTSTDLDSVTIRSFPLPSTMVPSVIVPDLFKSILPMPDESWILICTSNDIQVCSLKFMDHTHNAPCHDIVDIDISGDTSLLALATTTNIEIWDAQIGQCLHIVQRQSTSWNRHITFSC